MWLLARRAARFGYRSRWGRGFVEEWKIGGAEAICRLRYRWRRIGRIGCRGGFHSWGWWRVNGMEMRGNGRGVEKCTLWCGMERGLRRWRGLAFWIFGFWKELRKESVWFCTKVQMNDLRSAESSGNVNPSRSRVVSYQRWCLHYCLYAFTSNTELRFTWYRDLVLFHGSSRARLPDHSFDLSRD